MRIGTQLAGGRWLAPLFLLIGVLTPTVCVLWFMNVAVNNQRDASRRQLTEAYRGQLALLPGQEQKQPPSTDYIFYMRERGL